MSITDREKDFIYDNDMKVSRFMKIRSLYWIPTSMP